MLLNIQGWCCGVVGGGQVATRKIQGLLESGAQVSVISPTWTERIATWQAEGQISLTPQAYSPAWLDEVRPQLMMICTNSPSANHQSAQDAKVRGIWVNVSDSSFPSDFTPLAHFRRGPLTVGVGSQGASPALVAHLRHHLEAVIGPEYAILAEWLAQARPQAQAQLETQPERHGLWHTILASPILELLAQNRPQEARQHFDQLLQEALG